MATITVTGTYEDGSGLPVSGKVTFTPVVTGTDGTVVFIADPMVAVVAGGILSKDLTTTDTWVIDGAVTYKVVEKIGSTGRVRYFVSLPSSLGVTVDIATVAHYANPPNQLQLDAEAPVDFTSHLATDHSPITSSISALDVRIDALEAATAPDFYELPVDGIPQADLDAATETKLNNAIAKTIVDAKGDIVAATAADTVSRLAVGSNGQVLTADSATGTGLKWAAAGVGSDATKADVSGSISQFADVSATAPADQEVLRYETDTNLWTPADLTGQFAGLDANQRLASANFPQYYVPTLVLNEGATIPAGTPTGTIILRRQLTASITPVYIGEDHSEAATTCVVTTSQDVNVDDYLLIGWFASGETPIPTTFPSVTIGGGTGAIGTVETYTHQQGATIQSGILFAKCTTQIPTGRTITVTVDDSRATMGVTMAKADALLSTAVKDQNGSGGNTGSVNTSAVTAGATGQAQELALYMVGFNPGPLDERTIAGTNSWAAIGPQVISRGANERSGCFFYRELSATGTITGTATIDNGGLADSAWSATIVTLKAA